MVLDMDIQDQVQREINSIKNADRIKLGENSANTEILENLHGRGYARNFTFDYDEPEYVTGGTNRGPRPLEYFLAGWAFCQQVQYARNGLLYGIDFDAVEMDVAGDIDPRSFLDDNDVPSGFVDDELRMETHIRSDEDPDEIRRLVRLARKDCHAHACFQREMTLSGDVHLNGEPLDI